MGVAGGGVQAVAAGVTWRWPRLTGPLLLAAALAAGAALGGAASVLPPLLIAAALVGGVGLVGAAKWPEAVLLAIVAITCGFVNTERLPLLTLGPISLHLTDIMLMCVLALVVLRLAGERHPLLVRTPLDLPLAGFFAAVVFSAGVAIVFRGTDRSSVLRLVRLLTYYLAFFAVTNLVRGRRQLRLLSEGMLWLGAVAGALTLVQTLFPSIHVLQTSSVGLVTVEEQYQGVSRVYTQADRLMYPMLFVSLAALALRARLLPPALEAARATMLGLGMFLSFQRNYWATLAATAVLLFVLLPGAARRVMLRALLVALLVAAVVVSLPVPLIAEYRQAALDRVTRGMAPSEVSRDSSAQWRMMETRYGLRSIAAHPWLGVGVGSFYRPTVADDYYITGVSAAIGLRWYMHNTYLWVWVTMGLVGLIPFLALYGLAIYRGLRLWRRVRDPQLQAISLGITLGILGQAVSNIVAPNFVQSWSLIVFALLMGVNELIFRWQSRTDPDPTPAGGGD